MVIKSYEFGTGYHSTVKVNFYGNIYQIMLLIGQGL